jgi:ABC-type transport system involved in multi-copper enzyme maturation permease subunit
MNIGLIGRAIRETWLATTLIAAGLVTVQLLLAYAILNIFRDATEQVSGILGLRFVQIALQGLLGTEIGTQVAPEVLTAFAWVHPVTLALVWAHAILAGTRVPAAEVDRATIDVLLSLPVTRFQLAVAESASWLASGAVLVTAAAVGNQLGRWLFEWEYNPVTVRLLGVAVNLYALYACVSAMAFLASALSDRRGRAIAVAFALLLAQFLLNFLAPFWKPAETLSVLSLMKYYRPVPQLAGAGWPWADQLILLAAAAVLWLFGVLIFTRRDIRTV